MAPTNVDANECVAAWWNEEGDGWHLEGLISHLWVHEQEAIKIMRVARILFISLELKLSLYWF
jgi:hypothetical protein